MRLKSGSGSGEQRAWGRAGGGSALMLTVGGQSATETPSVADEKPTEATDVDLLRRAGDGDGRAFHTLVDRHAQRLYRLSASLVGNATDAEDVVQETFAGAFKGIRQFEGRASVKTWLTRILFTQAAKWRRDKKRRDFRPLEAAEGSGSTAAAVGDQAVQGVGAKMDLHAALKRLSEEHRQVLLLREFEGMAYEEMAEVLGVPRGTIESRLHRARNELREKLKSYAT
jgi:RNA polymerase sigma-70 factor (ECF subfamily)